MNNLTQIASACARMGLIAPEFPPAPGASVRIGTDTKPNGKDGWLRMMPDGAGFHLKNWSTDASTTVFFDGRSPETMTPEQRHELAEARRAAAEQRQREHDEAAARCAAEWSRSLPAHDHPYLVRKRCPHLAAVLRQTPDNFHQAAHGQAYAPSWLIVPAYSERNEIRSLVYIAADGTKSNAAGGEMAGCFFPIGFVPGSDRKPLYLAEGVATAATIARVTGSPAVACFNAGNMIKVAEIFRRWYPERPIIVCADDDHKLTLAGKSNAGIEGARNAAKATMSLLAVPDFSGLADRGSWTDFNDLEEALGADAVRRCLNHAMPVTPDQPVTTVRVEPPIPDLSSLDTGEADYADAFCQWRTDLRYVHSWRKWMIYDGGVWRREDTCFAYSAIDRMLRAAVKEHAYRKPSTLNTLKLAKFRAGIETIARSDRRVAAAADQWDRHKWLLNTPGGVVDLKTGNLRPHDPDMYFTKVTLATPGGYAPRWLKFLEQVTGGDAAYIAFLQRFAGYSLTGDTKEQKLAFPYGAGENGKGVFMDTLTKVWNDYAKTASADTFMERKNGGDRHPADLAALRGARLVTAQEITKGAHWDESRIKTLTGEDEIACRHMGGDWFTYRPEFKLCIAGNNRPKFKTIDPAIRRRLLLLPFTVSFAGVRNDNLRAELLEEAGGILRWAVEGCLMWQDEGLNAPAIVTDTTKDYLDGEDDHGRWLEARTVRTDDPMVQTSLKELFSDWVMFASSAHLPQGRDRDLAERLEREGFAKKKTNVGQTFNGIRLKPVEYQPFSNVHYPVFGR